MSKKATEFQRKAMSWMYRGKEIEDHFKYRQAVIEAYPRGNYPVFEGYDHMQYQIRDPKGFAEMLAFIAEQDGMPKLPFIRK